MGEEYLMINKIENMINFINKQKCKLNCNKILFYIYKIYKNLFGYFKCCRGCREKRIFRYYCWWYKLI